VVTFYSSAAASRALRRVQAQGQGGSLQARALQDCDKGTRERALACQLTALAEAPLSLEGGVTWPDPMVTRSRP
jgi:hypothetical protein